MGETALLSSAGVSQYKLETGIQNMIYGDKYDGNEIYSEAKA